MSYTPLFTDRTDAGEKLAQKINSVMRQTTASGTKPVPIVYALPRGGLPVAAPVARILGCPLTIMVAKKISHPENPELAIGAVCAPVSCLVIHLFMHKCAVFVLKLAIAVRVSARNITATTAKAAPHPVAT